MNRVSRLRLLVGATLALICLAAAPLVSAEGSSGSGGTSSGDSHTGTPKPGSGDSSTSGGSTTGGSTGSKTPETHTGSDTGGGDVPLSSDPKTGTGAGDDQSGDSKQGSGESLQNRAELLLSEKRQNGKEHSTTQRQQACEQHQAAIDKLLGNLGQKAQAHLDTFNTLFQKVQAYQTKNQLNVSNYDALVADATAKQAAAATAVNALKALSPSIDCTASDPASSLAIDKTAADDARIALQNYRSSLKALIDALLAAQKATDTQDSTQGGNQ